MGGEGRPKVRSLEFGRLYLVESTSRPRADVILFARTARCACFLRTTTRGWQAVNMQITHAPTYSCIYNPAEGVDHACIANGVTTQLSVIGKRPSGSCGMKKKGALNYAVYQHVMQEHPGGWEERWTLVRAWACESRLSAAVARIVVL